jgi:predicted nucleic acid-binding Zn ribbon protein
MPLYVYRIIRPTREVGADQPDETFELRQSMQDPPLTRHPETGEPVERVICAPNISSSKIGNANLTANGFTKYTKRSDGTYEREAGSGGPKHIDPQKFQ